MIFCTAEASCLAASSNSVTSFDPCIVSKDLDSEVLIIHCRDDEDAGVSESIQLNTMVDGSELYIASGLGHRRILRDAEVVSRVVDFLRA